MDDGGFLQFENEGYIYDLFEKYQKDKKNVPPEWAYFFQGLELGSVSDGAVTAGAVDGERIVEYFKRNGHLYAKTNSLVEGRSFDVSEFLSYFSLSKKDLSQKVSAPSLGIADISIQELVDKLVGAFASDIGLQTFVPLHSEQEEFLTKKLWEREALSKEEVVLAVKEVGKAKLLEDFLQKKFLGAKRFSVEGGESVLSLLK
nr:hypothetical protein [bacterium]